MNTDHLIQETNDVLPGKTLAESPVRANAFELSTDEKIRRIKYHFAKIMDTLGLDLEDDSLKDTPGRVAKMYVNELFSGLNPDNKPRISLFENKYGYKKMLVEKDITFYSSCEHHFVPIIGRAHVAYIPGKQVVGLSKINRLVHYYARRPQVQERLTIQIAEALKEILRHNDVAVVIEAEHLCVASRGIKDTAATTVTASYSGQFENETIKQELLAYIYSKK
ncbi:GTP cyclohydrolase I FolE [Niabella soli]|uniref:GTP cyclohydrolase 1 n=1 Tax=Niabella soli DSM 19437 TaxID=929713 RepID=W0EZB3_9BACT|nr:GTP cyclohydrolase I FolE [Niabella soli]AHF14534.1 GTP cyclohydrolase [Niabella soli DSM 19437]